MMCHCIYPYMLNICQAANLNAWFTWLLFILTSIFKIIKNTRGLGGWRGALSPSINWPAKKHMQRCGDGDYLHYKTLCLNLQTELHITCNNSTDAWRCMNSDYVYLLNRSVLNEVSMPIKKRRRAFQSGHAPIRWSQAVHHLGYKWAYNLPLWMISVF